MGYIQLSLFGENVMGAFSSNDRMDFRAVLQSFSDTEISMPSTGGWANAGMVRGERLTCAGGSWMPSIGESPGLFSEERESSLWQILEDSVPQKYYLSPVICSRFLRLAQTTGCPPPEPVEYLLIKQGGKIPVIRPFQERRMRSAAKSGNQSAFLASFGRPDEPFPTLLAKAVNMISFWYEGEEKDGVLRNLTPVECERLMGLPEGWTAYGNLGQPISDNARCKALEMQSPCRVLITSWQE